MKEQDIECNNTKKEIIKKIFPDFLPTPEELDNKYPPRKLKEGAIVSRFCPSPTGFMHIGGLYASLIPERLAHQSGGVFFVRIEDTDKEREVEGAAELIANSLNCYNIKIDEGDLGVGKEIGEYGPYTQSKRRKIYQTYLKLLLEEGLAYPCFCTREELTELREIQQKQGIRTGYYGKWAKWREKSDREVLDNLNAGKKFVIRYRSNGNFEKRININDIILGERELPENDQDVVIMKSDGLPTYHFAHVVDDHLMRTTHVIRGNEWLSSLPLHLQLFEAMNWQPPVYGHIFAIQKLEGQSKRKLSKRKDPEADITYYDKEGYPEDAVIEYLLNLANSNFEDWRKENPKKSVNEFKISVNKLSCSSGPLFDLMKLNDIGKDVIAKYSAEEIYEKVLAWAKKYNPNFAKTMENDPKYVKDIFNIERGDIKKTRKDFAKWKDAEEGIEYFFDQYFDLSKERVLMSLSGIDSNDVNKIIDLFIKTYNENDTKEEWFSKMKETATSCGYTVDMKAYKNNPEQFKGNISHVAKIFRVLLTGRENTPDLYCIMKVMGKYRVIKRIKKIQNEK